jgi:glycerophosphoryl diester phosphodiesterase
MNLLRDGGPVLRVGHRGAAALAPENTLRSIEAALEAGVDMVELDVLALRNGRLVLGHSERELAPDPLGLDDALDFLGEQLPQTLILADIKRAGYERALAEALGAHEVVERTLAASSSVAVLRRLGEAEDRLARSLTYPRRRVALGARRRALPHRIEHLLAQAGASAATLNRRVITPAVVDRCHALGVPVLVWTVNDPAELARLDALGVDAVISDDPGIFRG